MEITLKIRGIYSTALTNFFIAHGLTIAAPSEAVIERFKNSQNINPDGLIGVNISDMENRQGILLTGNENQVNDVTHLLKESFFDAICRKGKNNEGFFVEIEFPYLAKFTLDEFRNGIIPTLFNHHRLRLIDSEYTDFIEKNKSLDTPEGRVHISQDIEKELIWNTYEKGKELGIEHVKLNGQIIHLSEGKIVNVYPETKELILKRAKFKGRTKYDGLNTPKEKGDFAITEVKEGEWFYNHTYFRQDGQLIGQYYNINTFIEFYPDKIRYIDLEIDCVKWPNGKTAIIDEDALDREFEAGTISPELKEIAHGTAYKLKSIKHHACQCQIETWRTV